MKNKISNTGKKKLERQIKIWLKDIKAFMKDYGFCKEDNYYQEIIDIVWNFVDDSNIVSWSTEDSDTCTFIEGQIDKLTNAVEKS